LDRTKISAVLFALKGSYPDDIKKATTIASWLIAQKKMKELCTENKQ
jgi:hypothetical protein